MEIGLKRLLLVEDNPHDIELTLEALSEYRISNRTDIARDGTEALDYLYRQGKFKDRPEGNPVAILLDIKLPKVNGLEVLKRIRSDERLKLIPVAILSSSREEQDLIQGYELGVNAYIVKPVEFQKFVDAVKALGLFWAILNEPPPGCLQ